MFTHFRLKITWNLVPLQEHQLEQLTVTALVNVKFLMCLRHVALLYFSRREHYAVDIAVVLCHCICSQTSLSVNLRIVLSHLREHEHLDSVCSRNEKKLENTTTFEQLQMCSFFVCMICDFRILHCKG